MKSCVQCVLKLSSSFKFYAFAHRYCFDYIFWISNYVIKTIALIPSSFIPIIVVSSTGTKEGSVKRYQSSFSSSNVSHATAEVLAEAMGLIEAGWTQQAVANRFGVTTRVVRKWLTKRRSGEALANKPGRGWKPKLNRVSKIVIGKSLQKKGFSTRKLTRKLTACGHPVSKSTVHKYLRNNIHAVPYGSLGKDVCSDISTRWSTSPYQQKGSRMVLQQSTLFLEERYMARQLPRFVPNWKPMSQPPERASLDGLKKQLQIAWEKKKPETLEILYNSVPNRIRKCIKLKGEHINK